MRLRSRVLLTVFMIVLMTPTSVYAMRFWWFQIEVDGKPAFRGGLGGSGNTSLTILGAIHRAGIQLGSDSSFDANATGDITLKGDIVFSFPDLPDMQLQQLRLVYKQETRYKNWRAGGYFDWHLHPDDADMIIKHYGAPARRVNAGSMTNVAAKSDAPSDNREIAVALDATKLGAAAEIENPKSDRKEVIEVLPTTKAEATAQFGADHRLIKLIVMSALGLILVATVLRLWKNA